jgi:hypothetical protein
LEQLHELGIEISKGQMNDFIVDNKGDFHQEKNDILATGLEGSAYINVDDTGSRHKGKNGYCTHIGNDLFSYFESTGSKSRINFLRLLRAVRSEFIFNRDAIADMKTNRLYPIFIRYYSSTNAKTGLVSDDQFNILPLYSLLKIVVLGQ